MAGVGSLPCRGMRWAGGEGGEVSPALTWAMCCGSSGGPGRQRGALVGWGEAGNNSFKEQREDPRPVIWGRGTGTENLGTGPRLLR